MAGHSGTPLFRKLGISAGTAVLLDGAPAGALWIAWPKRASGMKTDLDENVIREYALAHGRVDVKPPTRPRAQPAPST